MDKLICIKQSTGSYCGCGAFIPMQFVPPLKDSIYTYDGHHRDGYIYLREFGEDVVVSCPSCNDCVIGRPRFDLKKFAPITYMLDSEGEEALNEAVSILEQKNKWHDNANQADNIRRATQDGRHRQIPCPAAGRIPHGKICSRTAGL